MRRIGRRYESGQVTRGEWLACAGVAGLTIAVGMAIWHRVSMRWPLSAAGWVVALSGGASVVLIVAASVVMRGSKDRPMQPRPESGGWRWSSAPMSAANSSAAAKIGFRVTMVESVGRSAPQNAAPAPPRASRQAMVSEASSRAEQPDPWIEHLARIGDLDLDDDDGDEAHSAASSAPVVRAEGANTAPSPPAAGKTIAPKPRRQELEPPDKSTLAAAAGPAVGRGRKQPAASGPPLVRRAKREAAGAVARPPAPAAPADDLDDLAQRLLAAANTPGRRTRVSDLGDDADGGARPIVRDAPGVFVCPEARRD